MREIIFRGRRVDNREWVEGDLVHNTFDGTRRNIAIGIQEKGCYPVEVIPETVGQFTGLHDKEGKKIWEGDKLHVWEHNCDDKGFVHYSEDRCAFIVGKYGCTVGEFENIEVIGSIHTTP